MKIVGLIVEYNPLHNGHLYHFNTIKKSSQADIVIAVMSSSFTMRGEISVYDKFSKTQLALKMGIDIVIELPFVYAVNNADIFALESIRLLNTMKVNEIWIGSEENNVTLFEDYYLAMKTVEYANTLKYSLKKGLSYKLSSNASLINLGLTPLNSNDILGLAYYSVIKDNNYPINLRTIKREGNNFLDEDITSSLASAKALRNHQEIIKDYVPSYVHTEFLKLGFRKNSDLFNMLKYRVLSSTPQELKQIFLVSEGLENKIIDVYRYSSYESFLQHLGTKRYTNSRLQRILLYILFNITASDIQAIRLEQDNFVRILGFKKASQTYISSLKKNCVILTNVKEGMNKVIDIELRITKILDLIYQTNFLSNEQQGPIIAD